MDNKELKKINKELKAVINLLEKNDYIKDSFNFKLYNLFSELYNLKENTIFKNIDLDSEIEYYINDNYNMFLDDYKYNNYIEYKQYAGSSHKLNSDILEIYQDELYYKRYNENDISLLLDNYNADLTTSLKNLISDIENKKYYTLLKYIIINNVYIDNLLDDILLLKDEIILMIKSYNYIKKCVKNVDNVENFIDSINFSDMIENNDYSILKELNNKTVPENFIEDLLQYNFIVKKAGKYYKIMYHLYNKPVILKVEK